LREKGIPSVMGNYDDAVAWDKLRASRQLSSARNEYLKQAALDWAKSVIHPDHKTYLKALPWQLCYQLADKKIIVLHAGPAYLDEWLTPESPAMLEFLSQSKIADIIVLGHSHQPFSVWLNDVLFINPGTVGRALDGDTRASCSILNLTTLEVQALRIDYDLDAAVEAIRWTEMPKEIALLVKHGARRIEEVEDVTS
jgi:putative phosphoesterase